VSCWGAAKNDKQRALHINDERLAEQFAQQEAPEMPREILEFHILNPHIDQRDKIKKLIYYLSTKNLEIM